MVGFRPIRFGAARATGRIVPTWQVTGTVRHVGFIIPTINLFIFMLMPNRAGVLGCPTIAEPHRIRATAPDNRVATLDIGRMWGSYGRRMAISGETSIYT